VVVSYCCEKLVAEAGVRITYKHMNVFCLLVTLNITFYFNVEFYCMLHFVVFFLIKLFPSDSLCSVYVHFSYSASSLHIRINFNVVSFSFRFNILFDVFYNCKHLLTLRRYVFISDTSHATCIYVRKQFLSIYSFLMICFRF
jgi:hypothetical protein